MIVELSSLYRLIRTGRVVKSGKFVMVTLSRKLTPFSFFNYICYSENEKSSAALDIILDHEKVHARQWHSVDVLLSHLYRAVFWINPLSWWLKKQIGGENLEFIADAEAKTQIKSGVSYERTLLSSAAFHLQPSLANNFFTPFIKKRIMMLQKEASARWNAYKYALILPVIVVFLYSFNVVTEVEYLEVDIEKSLNSPTVINEGNEVKSTIPVMLSNTDSTFQTVDELIYDIKASTTDEDLTTYTSQINKHANYQVRFSDQERDENNGLKRLSISTKFPPGKKWNKNMTIGTEPFKLLLIKASKEKLWVNDDSSSETLYVNKDGVHIEMGDDWTYGDLNIEQTEDFKWESLDHRNVNIYIKITPTSTKESLEEHKKFLKESHNVDFKYSKLRYRDGKLVSIKIELDDNDGTKISQTYKNDTAIPNICINGSIKGDHKNWKLNNCEDAPQTTYQLGDVKYMNLSPDEYRRLTQTNVDSIMQTIKMSSINMDSLQNQIDLQLMNINFDSIESHIQKSLIYINSDSISNYYQELPDLNDLDDIDYSRFEQSNNNLSSGSYIVMNNSNGEKPLVIVDGKESNRSILNGNMDMSNVASMNVLKGKDATDLYGAKGEDGVILITTKDGEELKELPSSVDRRALMDQRRLEMDSLRAMKKDQMESRREELLQRRVENRQQAFIKRDSLKRRVSIDSIRIDRNMRIEERRAAILQERERKKDEINKRREHIIANSRNGESTTSEIITSDTLMNFSEAMLEKYGEKVRAKGYSFNIKTFKERNGKVVKLKIEFAGTDYAIATNKGINKLTFDYFKNGSSPKMTSVSN
nr:TonB-dependent receptor plug domain-containing protein [Nonlabens ulvanivorans]